MNKQRTEFQQLWPRVLLMRGAAGGAGTADMTNTDECDENGKEYIIAYAPVLIPSARMLPLCRLQAIHPAALVQFCRCWGNLHFLGYRVAGIIRFV